MYYHLLENIHFLKKRCNLIKRIVFIIFVGFVFFLGLTIYSYGQWVGVDFAGYRAQQSALAWGDVNNDGWLDIVIAGNDLSIPAQYTRVLINNKDGLTFTSSELSGSGFYCGSVSLVDFDSDGDLDLSINGSVPGASGPEVIRHRIYTNQGDGTFGPGYIEPVSGWGTWYGNVEWADYNNDGRMDFAIVGDTDGPGVGTGETLRIYRNTGNGTFAVALNAEGAGYGWLEYGSVAWGDFDNDGDLDIVFAGINGTAGGPNLNTFKLQWYRNDGGGFTGPLDVDDAFAPALGYKRASIAVGDFNNDGAMDFAVSGHSSIDEYFMFRLYRNTGGGTFAESDIAGANFGVIGGSLAAGDVNNDGNLDIVMTGYNGTAKILYVYLGNGAGGFGAPLQPEAGWGVGDDSFTPPTEFGRSGCSLALGDFDNDNDLDIAVTGRDPSAQQRFRIYKNGIGANTVPGTPAGLQTHNNGGNWKFQWNAAGDAQTPATLMRYQIAIGTNTSGVYNYTSTNIYYPRGQAQVGNSKYNQLYMDTVIPRVDQKQVYWRIAAIDTSFKDSAWSAEQTVVPEWVSSTVISTNQINLLWRRFNVNNATSYTLYRNTTKNPVGSTKIYINNGNTTNYNDNQLVSGTTYFYWLNANTTWGTTTPLSVAMSNRTIPLYPPQWVSATAVSTSQIDLAWHDLNNESSYTLFRNTVNNSNTATKIGGVAMNVTNYNDNTCQPGTTYYYWLKGYNIKGSSEFSLGISTITFPARPNWVSATAIATNRIDLRWYDVRNETSYTLYRNNVNNSNTAARIGNTAANVTNFSDTSGLSADTRYFYWVRAFNSSGPSPYSVTISNVTFPARPAWISATALSTNVIRLLWHDQRYELEYLIYRSTVDNTNTAVFINNRGASVTNYDDTSLQSGTTYYYWLKARNSSGTSFFSVSISTITRSAKPQWIYARAITTNSVGLRWYDLPNETSFTLFRNTVNVTNTAVKVTGLGANITNYSDTNLISETTYYYWLKSYNASGDSPFSDPIMVKVGRNIISKILFPLHNSFLQSLESFEGEVSSLVFLSNEHILLQRLSDNKYYDGTDWQNTESWLLVNGTTNWSFNLFTEEIFEYGVQYSLKARGTDVYGLVEAIYPESVFTYVYSTDFKKSTCNYPNPFFPDSSDPSKNTTTIEYLITRPMEVKVHIYAINGELVKRWVGGEYGSRGLHRIVWDGRNDDNNIVSSGMYLLIINADNKRKIEKIAVIR
ncbi:MAG: VCBS repeat-containing protein [Spirochaetes bacterium]|nr:VCBS repeat-containing protein [Spirochaetota bacterium]